MTKLTVALDAGHGLKTAGKQTPDGIKEWVINDAVCDLITNYLINYDCEVIRLDRNEGVVDEGLTKRLNTAINAGANVLVSIHHNAYKGIFGTHSGVEVYTDNKPTAEDSQLAALIYHKLVKYTGLKGRGLKKAAFTVINTNKITAVLCEGGFMDSSIDYAVITSPAGQQAYANAVAESIVELYGLKKMTTSAKSDKVSITYQVYDNKSKRWLPNVVDLSDYAGVYGRTIGGVYANLSKGNVHYMVHLKGGKWLPLVTNRLDYAGIKGKAIDGLSMYTAGTGKKIYYAVHLKSKNKWLPYVTGFDITDSNNGYAGILGQEIDGIKIHLE